MKRVLILKYLLVLAMLVITGCDKNDSITGPETPDYSRGEIVGTPTLKVALSNDAIKLLAPEFDLDENLIGDFSINIYSIKYKTINKDGELVEASGALYVPQAEIPLPLLSYHHGTEFKREKVASQNPLTNGIEASLAATLGYITCAPDYLGFGVSEITHPYIIASLSASASIDFLRACRTFCNEHGIEMNEQLFLAGYSEGGYVTLAVHKEIEEKHSDEFTITASAPMAGPYDLLTTAEILLQQGTVRYPSFIGFLLTAYNDNYGWNRLEYIFNSPYDGIVAGLFNGSFDKSHIEGQLTSDLSLLLNQKFREDFLAGKNIVEREKFAENSLLGWTPRAPIQFVHGQADDVVPFQNSVNAFNSLSAGSNVPITLIPIPGGDHATSVIPSISATILFFKQYRTDSPGAQIAVNF